MVIYSGSSTGGTFWSKKLLCYSDCLTLNCLPDLQDPLALNDKWLSFCWLKEHIFALMLSVLHIPRLCSFLSSFNKICANPLSSIIAHQFMPPEISLFSLRYYISSHDYMTFNRPTLKTFSCRFSTHYLRNLVGLCFAWEQCFLKTKHLRLLYCIQCSGISIKLIMRRCTTVQLSKKNFQLATTSFGQSVWFQAFQASSGLGNWRSEPISTSKWHMRKCGRSECTRKSGVTRRHILFFKSNVKSGAAIEACYFKIILWKQSQGIRCANIAGALKAITLPNRLLSKNAVQVVCEEIHIVKYLSSI